jgi:hypothetical protein
VRSLVLRYEKPVGTSGSRRLVYEDLYAKFILKLNREERYLYRATEQEAYLNQEDMHYLQKRHWYALLKYIKHKKRLQFVPKQSPRVIPVEEYT